jgi:hypothetical protein
LFAAHCLQNKKEDVEREASESYFYFKNDYDTGDESENTYVSEFILHPDWNPKDRHFGADIAIAVLKQPLKITKNISHVCLNTPANPIQSLAGKNGKVYGWGLTENFKTVTELRHVDVPLVNQTLCNATTLVKRLMSDTSFCAGARDGRSGACNGNYFYIHFY